MLARKAEPVVSAFPAPVTLNIPNVADVTEQYQVAVTPAVGFCVTDNQSFIEAGERFNAVKDFIDYITALFKKPKADAYQAHKSITALESQFLEPALQAKKHLADQQLAWRDHLKAIKLAEEQRLQREAQAQAEADRVRQQAILDAEAAAKQRLLDEAAAERLPWEIDENEPTVVERVVLPEPEVAPVRLPSNVPFVAGGPAVRNSPWMAKVDLKALVLAASKDDRLLQYLEPKMPLLNAAAREHGQCVGDIIPGVTAYREERLARG